MARTQNFRHTRGGKDAQHLTFYRSVYSQASERDAAIRAMVNRSTPTGVTWHLAIIAGVGNVELPSAASAAQKSREQTAPLARRAPHHHTLHLRVVRDQPPVAFVSVPIDITFVMLAQQYDPLFALTLMTARLVRTTVNHASTSSGAAEGVCAGIDRITKDLVNRAVDRQTPLHLSSHAMF